MNALLRNRQKILKYVHSGVQSSCSYCKSKTTLRQPCLHGQKRTYGNSRVLPYPQHLYLASQIYTKPMPLASSYFYYDRVCNFSLSHRLLENPSSKVEVTVQSMKNKQKEKVEEIIKDATNTNILKSDAPTEVAKPAPVKKSLKTRIWEEVLHYYHGFRLLFIDINICRKLLWRVLNGNTLTRRENRLLVRTTSDLFRLIPFSVFIIVPFMELLLPVFIKFFPGMLPSTFQTSKEREDKLKQSLQVRLEMAKFLQKTLDEMAVQHKDDHKSEEAKQFVEFFEKIKNPNEYVPSDQIIKFSKHFADEITLDSLSREQLVALCRVLELNTMGTTNLLRFLLRIKLRSLSADDRVIAREGVNALDLFELQQACKSRGMRAYGLTAERLRAQLQEWIDLSLNDKVPPTLLLLSRAMLISDDSTTTDKLARTIRVLPDSVAAQTKAAIGESEGKIDNKTKIEVIKEEERKIKEEREEQKAQEKAKKEKHLEKEKEKEKEQLEILLDKAPVISTDEIRTEVSEPTTATVSAPTIATKEPAKEPTAEEGGTISSKDVEILSEALKTLSSEKQNMPVEKETIKDLKEELEDYKEDIEELREVRNVVKEPVHESRAAKLLFKKVNNMIGQLDKVLVDLEKKHQQLIETREKQTGVTTPPEATPVAGVPGAPGVKRSDDELIRIDELVNAIKKVKQVSDESRLKQIEAVLSKLDTDKDGVITVDEVLKVVEAIGRDNIALDSKQLEDLLTLLDKEQIIEAEEKIEKAIAKSMKEAKKIEKKAGSEGGVAEGTVADGTNVETLAAVSDELKDKAPVLKDKAKDLSDDKAKNIVKDETEKSRKDTAIMAEAAKAQAEKLLPPTDVPTEVLPPTVPSAPPTAKKNAN